MSNKLVVRAVHDKLKGIKGMLVKCPKCGYVPELFEFASIVKLTIVCPQCFKETSMRAWGLRWNWE